MHVSDIGAQYLMPGRKVIVLTKIDNTFMEGKQNAKCRMLVSAPRMNENKSMDCTAIDEPLAEPFCIQHSAFCIVPVRLQVVAAVMVMF